jgi:hypothetical protein
MPASLPREAPHRRTAARTARARLRRFATVLAAATCGLVELRPEPDATTRYPFVTLEWARQWPCEEVWKARKSFLEQSGPSTGIPNRGV